MAMPAWTGGQYSLVRALFGLYLLVRFSMLLQSAAKVAFPSIATTLLVVASVASLFFAIGLYDRVAAVVMGLVLVCFFGRNPLISDPAIAFAGILLLAHVLLPPAPFGSWAARGRVDPRGGWTFRRPIWVALWVVTSVAYGYSGWTKLVSRSWTGGISLMQLALELLYAPLALFRHTRPWIWLAMLLMQLGLATLADSDLSSMMVIVHLFTFDPAWIPRREPATTDVVQYDGSCGLCHRSVRFLISEDASGTAFTFEPLSVESESVIVRTADGRTLQQSDAVIHLCHRLGGYWRAIGAAFSLIPRVVRNTMYDGIAKIRYRIFGRTKDACPILPPDLRSRFL